MRWCILLVAGAILCACWRCCQAVCVAGCIMWPCADDETAHFSFGGSLVQNAGVEEFSR